MKLSYITIPEILERIQKEQLLIPHLQRNYVWQNRNIYNFLDSIMRNYPFSPFYFWNKKKEIHARSLIRDYEKKKDQEYYSNPKVYRGSNKWFILDGQQRIQSLYLSLIGSRDNKDMYIDFTGSPDKTFPFARDGSISQYKFKFMNEGRRRHHGYIKVTELYKALKDVKKSVNKAVIDALYKSVDNWKRLIDDSRENNYEDNILDTLTEFHKAFVNAEFSYGLIRDEDKDEEVFNIFTRINNGGMKLSFADTIFIYFKTFWPQAQKYFGDLLNRIPKRFSVDYTFLIKASITLLKNNCEFDIAKIDKHFVEQLKENWKRFSHAIITAFELLHKVFIYDNSTLRSNLSLIPIIYAIYHKQYKFGVDSDDFRNELKRYIYISHIKDVFASKPETTVNKVINGYLKNNKFNSIAVLRLIIGTNFQVNKYDIESVTGQKNAKLILNLIYYQYGNFLSKKNSYSFKLDIDHIFPKSDCEHYFTEKNAYNNILNYCYLSGDKNKRIKLRTPPDRFFTTKNEYQKHLLPTDGLFRYNVKENDPDFVRNFERFKKKRLNLLVKKINAELRNSD